MSETALINIEIAYALPHEYRIVALEVPEGTTVLAAAQQSDITSQFPDLTLDESSRMGIYGQVVSPSQALKDGDRVEIYRPLQADPKEVRKARAARARERRAQTGNQDAAASSDDASSA